MKNVTFTINETQDLSNAINAVKSEINLRPIKSMVMHLYVCIADKNQGSDMVRTLQKEFPEAVVAGIAASTQINDGKTLETNATLSVSFFYKSFAYIMTKKTFASNEEKLGQYATEYINGIPDAKACEILICNNRISNLSAFFNKFESCKTNIAIFGGFALGYDMFNGEKYIITEEGCSDDGFIIIVYAGKELHVNSAYTAGWTPLGKEMTITKADSYTIYEIDHQPPSHVICRYLGLKHERDFSKKTSEFPLLVCSESGNILRHLNKANNDYSITMDAHVETNMKVRLSYGDPESILNEVNKRCIELANFSPDYLYLIPCAIRKIFWGNFFENELAPFQKITKTSGFCCGGELSRDAITGKLLWHNITMVSIGFREGEPTKAITPPTVEINMNDEQAFLVKRLMSLVKATTADLEEMAIHDSLTGLFNRGKTELIIDNEIQRIQHLGGSIGLIMVDIDYFKKVNDTYGHAVGDCALIKVGSHLKDFARRYTHAAAGRWGGEEFFLVIQEIDKDEALDCAEALRLRIYRDDILPDHKPLTISAGVCIVTPSSNLGSSNTQLYADIDDALYRAKKKGRNCVVYAYDDK